MSANLKSGIISAAPLKASKQELEDVEKLRKAVEGYVKISMPQYIQMANGTLQNFKVHQWQRAVNALEYLIGLISAQQKIVIDRFNLANQKISRADKASIQEAKIILETAETAFLIFQTLYEKLIKIFYNVSVNKLGKEEYTDYIANTIPSVQKMAAELICALGIAYRKGETVPKLMHRALEMVTFASNLGDALAACVIGNIYIEDDGFLNYSAALQYFQLAAKRGLQITSVGYAQMYLEGFGVKIDYKIAAELFEKALNNSVIAESNRVFAQFGLGKCLFHLNNAKDHKRMIELLQQAANKGYGSASALLSECYSQGRGVPKNPQRAQLLLQQAADADRPDFDIAFKYVQSHDDTKDLHEFNTVLRYLSVLAGNKNPHQAEAAVMLGLQGIQGRIDHPDPGAFAIKCFRIAAELNSAKGHSTLAQCLFAGTGTEQDVISAAQHFEKAAMLGEIIAIPYLAACYANGFYFSKNPQHAIELLVRSAAQNLRSIFELSNCYEQAIGVVSDRILSLELKKLALLRNFACEESIIGHLARSNSLSQKYIVLLLIMRCLNRIEDREDDNFKALIKISERILNDIDPEIKEKFGALKTTVEYLESAAQKEDPHALATLGFAHMMGLFFEQNANLAIQYFWRALRAKNYHCLQDLILYLYQMPSMSNLATIIESATKQWIETSKDVEEKRIATLLLASLYELPGTEFFNPKKALELYNQVAESLRKESKEKKDNLDVQEIGERQSRATKNQNQTISLRELIGFNTRLPSALSALIAQYAGAQQQNANATQNLSLAQYIKPENTKISLLTGTHSEDFWTAVDTKLQSELFELDKGFLAQCAATLRPKDPIAASVVFSSAANVANSAKATSTSTATGTAAPIVHPSQTAINFDAAKKERESLMSLISQYSVMAKNVMTGPLLKHLTTPNTKSSQYLNQSNQSLQAASNAAEAANKKLQALAAAPRQGLDFEADWMGAMKALRDAVDTAKASYAPMGELYTQTAAYYKKNNGANWIPSEVALQAIFAPQKAAQPKKP